MRGSVAIKIKKVAKANKKNTELTRNIDRGNVEQFIVTIFEQMLLDYKTYQPEHIGWLLSSTFLNEEIPKEIIRQNFLTKEQLNWKRV